MVSIARVQITDAVSKGARAAGSRSNSHNPSPEASVMVLASWTALLARAAASLFASVAARVVASSPSAAASSASSASASTMTSDARAALMATHWKKRASSFLYAGTPMSLSAAAALSSSSQSSRSMSSTSGIVVGNKRFVKRSASETAAPSTRNNHGQTRSSSSSSSSLGAFRGAAPPTPSGLFQGNVVSSASTSTNGRLGYHNQLLRIASGGSTSGSSTTSTRGRSLSSASAASFEPSTHSHAPAPLASSRAHRAVELLPSYLTDARAVQRYHPTTCPEGALQLSVAENQLSEKPLDDEAFEGATLVEALNRMQTTSSGDNTEGGTFTRDMIYYQPTHGTPSLRAALGNYLQNLLLQPESTSLAFDPEGLVAGSGCNAVLENLCICLSEPGDGVMIPTPYYAAFEFDLVARAGLHIVPLTTFEHHPETPAPSLKAATEEPVSPSLYYPNRSSLDASYERTVSETGRPPRILLLSHPNNPLGICYPPSVMQECIDWCREKGVHLVSDEIYAGSVYRPERSGGSPTFESAMVLASSSDSATGEAGLGLGPYVHLVYALSKDFALSGLRVGVAYSENPEIRLPLQKLNDLCQISSQTQLLVEKMMTATADSLSKVRNQGEYDGKERLFASAFLDSHRKNVRSRCDRLMGCLDEVGIPYLPADSGLFVWMDFRDFLAPLDATITDEGGQESLESKERRERVLYLKLMKEYGLLFTPGMSMKNERAGFFRCVFTAASDDEFALGLERIRNFVAAER